MNIYLCHALDSWTESISQEIGGPRYTEIVACLVLAETPGQAKSTFRASLTTAEYTDIRCELKLGNVPVQRERGPLADDDPLYILIYPKGGAP